MSVLASSQSPTPQSAVKRGKMLALQLVRAPSQSLAGPFGLNELGFYFYLFFFSRVKTDLLRNSEKELRVGGTREEGCVYTIPIS